MRRSGGEGRNMEAPALSPEKHRAIVLLRGLLIIAVGALLVDAGVATARYAALMLVVAFALSDLALLALRGRYLRARRTELLLGTSDLILVGLGIYLAGAIAGELTVSCLVMVLVVALGNRTVHSTIGAAAVGALHAWLLLARGSPVHPGRQLVLHILFLCSVGIYYTFMTDGIRRHRRRADAEAFGRRELTSLVGILEAVTSSLDLQKVTREVVVKLNEIVPSIRCSILYVDESMTTCTVIASHDTPDLEAVDLDLAKYPEIREAIETRDPVIIQDVLHDPRMADVRETIKEQNFQSLLVIPLIFGDDVLGTLCLKSAREDLSFSAREIKFCSAAARASANALKNAMLYHQVTNESMLSRNYGEKLGRILSHSPDLILTTDYAGCVTEFNRGAERLLGYRKDEVLGQHSSILLVEKDRDLVGTVLSSGVVPTYGCSLRGKDGHEREFELHLAALRDRADEVVGTLWLGRDVTEHKATQMRLLQAEKLSTIGEVISGVAHELNNPLSGVVGFSQLLMAKHGDGPASRYVERINDSALRCQKIVKNLLSFARAHKPERKQLGINGIIEKTLELKSYQLRVSNIELETELDTDLPCTMVDFHQLQQVLMNLINNAQHAMAAARDRKGQLRVRTSQDDGTIRLEISDNGEGMDESTIQRIFDPFFTTKDQGEGTGLGLSISYGIVKEHGGRIYAHSRKGEGTTFFVELPIVKPPDDEPEPSTDHEFEITGSGVESRILLVDDEPMILDLLIDILEELGHQVDTASNGNEAFRKVESGEFDLVITDVRMPQMNGLELYRNILTAKPELEGKVIFITGDLMDRETVEFLEEVDVQTIPKPLNLSKVAEAVDVTLGLPPGS